MKRILVYLLMASASFAQDTYILVADWVDDKLVVKVNEVEVYSFLQPNEAGRDTLFDLTKYLKKGTNSVRLQVYDVGRVWWNADFKIFINNKLYWKDHESGNSTFSDPELRYNKTININIQ